MDKKIWEHDQPCGRNGHGYVNLLYHNEGNKQDEKVLVFFLVHLGVDLVTVCSVQ